MLNMVRQLGGRVTWQDTRGNYYQWLQKTIGVEEETVVIYQDNDVIKLIFQAIH